MRAYIYKADIYCEDCAKQIVANGRALFWPTVMKDDSEYYPQGPYSNGGGEADTPQHCGSCHEFLENPLTGDGYEYVAEAIGQRAYHGDGNKDVLWQWAMRYSDENVSLDNAIQEWKALKPEDWT